MYAIIKLQCEKYCVEVGIPYIQYLYTLRLISNYLLYIYIYI